MVLSNHGHSRFLIRLEDGTRIVTDPFDGSTGYPVGNLTADVVTVSHHHSDHDAVETLAGNPRVLEGPGTYTLSSGVQVIGISSWHDDQHGARRGPNTIFCLHAEGMNIVHLGDLGHILDEDTVQKIGKPDVLMIPVGGFFTIDAAAAVRVCQQLNARIVIPMHYRTEYNADWPIEGPEAFLTQYGEPSVTMPLLRVTAEDLSCQPRLVMLAPQLET